MNDGAHGTWEQAGGGRTDHGRVLDSGAFTGALIVSAFLAWADTKMPLLCAWLVNTAVILGVSWAMAAWKRAWYAWLAFWGMSVICVIDGCLDAVAYRGTTAVAAVWPVACAYVFIWYWLVRSPRRQPPPPPQVIHVMHHGLPGQVTAVPVPVTAPGRKVITGRVIRAIESPASLPGAASRLASRTRKRP